MKNLLQFYIDTATGLVFRSKPDALRYIRTGEISKHAYRRKNGSTSGEEFALVKTSVSILYSLLLSKLPHLFCCDIFLLFTMKCFWWKELGLLDVSDHGLIMFRQFYLRLFICSLLENYAPRYLHECCVDRHYKENKTLKSLWECDENKNSSQLGKG